MFERQIEELLARVEHPSRYVGGEVNASAGEPAADDRKVCLVYPGSYEDGVLCPALNALYGVLAGQPGWHVERAFRPAPDMEAALMENGLSWFSLETWRPLPAFDLVVLLVPKGEPVVDELQFLTAGVVLKTKALRWPAWESDQEARARAFFLGSTDESLRGLERGTDLLRPGAVPLIEPPAQPPSAGPAGYIVPYGSARGAAVVDCPVDLAGELPERLLKLVKTTGLEKFQVRLSAVPEDWPPLEALEAGLEACGAKAEFVVDGAKSPALSLPRSPRRPVEAKRRLRFRLERKGRLRWLSHLEHIQAVRRAFRRAGLRLATDAGRSPKARLAFGPAVSVGHESESDYVDAWMAEAAAPAAAASALGAALPPGYRVLEARMVPLHFPSVEAAANAALWEAAGDWPSDLDERLADFDRTEELWIEKKGHKTSSRIDLRAAATLSREGGSLRLRLRFRPGASLRPEEALKALGLRMDSGGSATAAMEASTAATGASMADRAGTGDRAAGSTAAETAARGARTGKTGTTGRTGTIAAGIRLVRKELFTVSKSGETLSL